MREPHRADIERKRRRDLGDRRTGHWRSHHSSVAPAGGGVGGGGRGRVGRVRAFVMD
jgi:hypothetical protein